MHRLLNLVSYNSHVQRVVHVVMLDSQLKERPILSIRRLTSQHDCVSFVKASPLHIVNNRDAPDIRPFFSVMWIRLNYYTDPDPGSDSLHTNPDPRKKPHKIQFLKILWKKRTVRI